MWWIGNNDSELVFFGRLWIESIDVGMWFCLVGYGNVWFIGRSFDLYRSYWKMLGFESGLFGRNCLL